jgi:Flp pilus assembly protein TadB
MSDVTATRWAGRLALYFAYAAAAIFVIVWHWRHLLDALPFLVVLACPLMHLFMHHGHDHHGTGDTPTPRG